MTELTTLLESERKFYQNEKETAEFATNVREKFEKAFGVSGIDKILSGTDTKASLISCGDRNRNKSLLSKILNNTELMVFGSVNTTTTTQIPLYFEESSGKYKYGKEYLTDRTAEERSRKIFELLKSIVEHINSNKPTKKEDYKTIEKYIETLVSRTGVKNTFVKQNGKVKSWLMKYLNIIFPENFCSFYAPWWLESILNGIGEKYDNEESEFINNGLLSLKINDAMPNGMSKDFAYRIILNCFDDRAFVFGADLDMYDCEKAFEENGFVDWSCDWKEVERHSVVYLYVTEAGKEGRIRYKCVVDKKLTKEETIDDSKFWKKSADLKGTKFVRLVLKETRDLDALKYTYLNSQYKFKIQGKLSINEGEKKALKLFLKDCFDNPNKYGGNRINSANLITDKEQIISEELRSYLSQNVIFYGVPGCGKSYTIKQLLKGIDECYYKRILFHPEYSYSDLIGQIVPKIVDGKPTYDFVAGPMTQILKEATANSEKQYFLVIEEINRGNAPAIFGDFFQLLDRKSGSSEYPIDNADIAKIIGSENGKVGIPKNLTIFATMNTCDQNVFTLDTAFKRRFRMCRIRNSFPADERKIMFKSGRTLDWKAFAEAVNQAILNNCNDGTSAEDKQLGAYFVKENELEAQIFAEKIFMYLWDDVVKYDKEQLFKPAYKTLDKVIEDFVNEKNVFNERCEALNSLFEIFIAQEIKEADGKDEADE